MANSPSTRLDNLVSMSTASGAAGDGPRAPVSLLDLPEELLSAIFDQLYQVLRSHRLMNRSGILVPVAYLFLNKRLYHLVRPLWFRHFSVPYGHPENDEWLSRLARHGDVHGLVASFDMEISWHFPSLQVSILALLVNLNSLTLSYGNEDEDGDWTASISTELLEALKQLKHLRNFRIVTSPTFEDEIDFDRSFPSLLHLDVQSQDTLQPFLAVNGPFLRKLTFRLGEHEDEDQELLLPWSRVDEIELRPDEGVQLHGDMFIAGLTRARGEEDSSFFDIPLKRLSLRFPALQSPKTDAPREFNQKHVLLILEQLQGASHLERLDFANVDSFEWQKPTFHVDSVRVVSLSGSFRLHKTDYLSRLHSFLSTFPFLRVFTLEGFTLSSMHPQTAQAISPLSTVELALRYPALTALFVVLRSTEVLELRFRGMDEKREMRWTRASKEDVFIGECWTLE
ncbi:hypothetical protein JCM8547_002957 [Rhodosporidiobolus lusitaniae]